MESEPLKIVVETWNSDVRESSKTIDHNDFHDRKWLGKHCFWAFRHGREIRTYPAKMA